MVHPLANKMLCATVTEFDDNGLVTTKNVPKYLNWLHKEQGLSGVFTSGTSGESMSCSLQERKEICKAWVDARNAAHLTSDDFAIVMHVTCQSVVESKELAAYAESVGADAIAVMSPSFFKPANAAQLAKFVGEVASACPSTDCLYYHFPTITNCTVLASDFFKAAIPTVPTLSGMKFTSIDIVDYGTCCSLDQDNKMAFLPGYENMTMGYLPFHASRGAYGGVSLGFNVMGKMFRELISLASVAGNTESGPPPNKKAKTSKSVSTEDVSKALELQKSSRDFFDACTEFGMLQTFKHALVLAKVFDSDNMRAPHDNLTDEQRQKIPVKMKAWL